MDEITLPIWVAVLIAAITIIFMLMKYMKWRMKASKITFAMAVLSSILACFVAGISSITMGLPELIIDAFFKSRGEEAPSADYHLLISLAILLLTIVISIIIYKFGATALKIWEAPATISELKLREKNKHNSLIPLAYLGFNNLAKGQSDPAANEALQSSDAKNPIIPERIKPHILLKDLLCGSIAEIRIDDENGWRDESKLWVGHILGLTEGAKSDIVALVFDSPPSKQEIRDRVDYSFDTSSIFAPKIIYCLYMSGSSDLEATADFQSGRSKIKVLSSREIILKSSGLTNYAHMLKEKYETSKMGGTLTHLRDSFVELNAKQKQNDLPAQPLKQIMNSWLTTDTKEHLVLTGEYGQGKSTAMLQYCYEWAIKFLTHQSLDQPVPLLIELRGKNPAESDPLSFLSSWAARYSLNPQQVFNLIKSGGAIVIFEGFDELRNSGKEYNRLLHFNALWKFAYPKTKIIFTGRPNFFLDDRETNQTLFCGGNKGAAGGVFTKIWELQKLTPSGIAKACRSYQSEVKDGITVAIEENSDFMEIVSRPSMLPVVATIWPEILELRETGVQLTGALLIEKYIRATFERKEEEVKHDQQLDGAAPASSYLALPLQARELLTICVAWRMASKNAKNTINRDDIKDMVSDIYDDFITGMKSQGVKKQITEKILEFEGLYKEEKTEEKIERITSEICSSGILVPDPAGGPSNLGFPHKQFYEYLVCKAFCIIRFTESSPARTLLQDSAITKNEHAVISNEPRAVSYLAECNGRNLKPLVSRSRLAINCGTSAYIVINFWIIKLIPFTHLIFKKRAVRNINNILPPEKTFDTLGLLEGTLAVLRKSLQNGPGFEQLYIHNFIINELDEINLHDLTLIHFRSSWYKEVRLTAEKPTDDSNIENFLGLAKEFGQIKKT